MDVWLCVEFLMIFKIRKSVSHRNAMNTATAMDIRTGAWLPESRMKVCLIWTGRTWGRMPCFWLRGGVFAFGSCFSAGRINRGWAVRTLVFLLDSARCVNGVAGSLSGKASCSAELEIACGGCVEPRRMWDSSSIALEKTFWDVSQTSIAIPNSATL